MIIRSIASILVVGAVALAAFAANPARADDSEALLTYRGHVMKSLGSHISAVFDILDGHVSYSGHIAGHANAMEMMAGMIPDIFPEGTQGKDSRAKPEIWQQWEKFVAAAESLATASAGLAAAAEGGDMGAIGVAAGAVGDACGGCHKPFRVKKD